MRISKNEKAWAAGFFEGEGHVHLGGKGAVANRALGTLQVEISQVDPEPLKWLAKRWGGKLYLTSPKTPKSRPFYRWVRMTQDAANFLHDIEPYLVRSKVKKRIKIAIAFQKQKRFELMQIAFQVTAHVK